MRVDLLQGDCLETVKNEHCDGRDFKFLIGKSIIKVEEKKVESGYCNYVLTCDDGTLIEVTTNEGCGGCDNGWSSFEDLKKLEENDNIITNIKTEYPKDKWEEDAERDGFEMFVYYADGTINKLEGDDGYGNGYYGGGFYVTVVKEGVYPYNRGDGLYCE